jgi:hypothetical protein
MRGRTGSPSSGATRQRRIIVAVLIAVAALTVAFSNQFGRAEPTGAYRHVLPPRTLDLPCFPLPGHARLNFGAVVRADGDVTRDGVARRRMVLHYLDLDAPAVRAELVEAFGAVGFTATPSSEARRVTMTRPNGERLTFEIAPFDVPAETVVKGEVTLDLPDQALASHDPWCADPHATKRFGGEEGLWAG